MLISIEKLLKCNHLPGPSTRSLFALSLLTTSYSPPGQESWNQNPWIIRLTLKGYGSFYSHAVWWKKKKEKRRHGYDFAFRTTISGQSALRHCGHSPRHVGCSQTPSLWEQLLGGCLLCKLNNRMFVRSRGKLAQFTGKLTLPSRCWVDGLGWMWMTGVKWPEYFLHRQKQWSLSSLEGDKQVTKGLCVTSYINVTCVIFVGPPGAGYLVISVIEGLIPSRLATGRITHQRGIGHWFSMLAVYDI